MNKKLPQSLNLAVLPQFAVIRQIFIVLDERPSSSASAVSSFPGKRLSFPPPPVKKPQRVGSSNLISAPLTKYDSPAEQRVTPDDVDGARLSRPSQKTSSQGLMDFDTEFDSVERSAMLTHPTATRVKAPHRRLPSTVYNKEAVSVENVILRICHVHFHVFLLLIPEMLAGFMSYIVHIIPIYFAWIL
jgi:hypothetical protein